MACIQFQATRFKPESIALIELCNEVIEDYLQQGLRLTLRQLYYQLVTKNAIPNVERSYKNLSTLVTQARLSGKMDWDAIEDRVRQARRASQFDGLVDLVDAALHSYRLPRWKGQDYYAELWVEKDALAGVLEPLAREHHVALMVNRGYSSASAMFESARRFIEACRAGEDDIELPMDEGFVAYEDGNEEMGSEPIALARKPVLFYLGDHDPSGEDMVRDVRERLHTFGIDVDVRKIALTMKQVEKYNPPPNPAKMTDPRANEYVAKHGRVSWEVDALPPQVLARIVRDSFKSVIDREKMDLIIEKEQKDKEKLRKAAEAL